LRDTNGHRVGLAYSLADAKLWASAPDLLAACQHVVDYCDFQAAHSPEEVALWAQCSGFARQAIAKAEG